MMKAAARAAMFAQMGRGAVRRGMGGVRRLSPKMGATLNKVKASLSGVATRAKSAYSSPAVQNRLNSARAGFDTSMAGARRMGTSMGRKTMSSSLNLSGQLMKRGFHRSAQGVATAGERVGSAMMRNPGRTAGAAAGLAAGAGVAGGSLAAKRRKRVRRIK